LDHMMKEDFRDLSQPVACLLRPNVFLFDCTVTILYCIVTIYLSAIRCFAVAGPRTWNSLLIKLRQPELSLEQFTLHYIYMFSARPTTARTGPAIQVSTIMLKIRWPYLLCNASNTNRNSSAIYRMVPFPMTLCDP